MKDILVKELMIPIANYVTVKKEDHLIDVLTAIETNARPNRDMRIAMPSSSMTTDNLSAK